MSTETIYAAVIESALGLVSIGGTGNDRHGPQAALIVDPGGDDHYERNPATRGAISVIVDLGGDDRYAGRDVAIRSFSAIVDFSGNDRYEMRGPGLAAAVAGASLLLDQAGNDRYEGRYFSQGAAAFGLGALIDASGNDHYRLQAWGQGFGAAGGIGLLWDRAGDDAYFAAGAPDRFERGSGLSGAQGAAFGSRTAIGGGIGILRDDAGDDAYEAQMFAQGLGYYFGIGLLWDGAGNDRYRAVRYAQGSAAHAAVGILRDESGDDSYELAFGVGQGMGLDLALGVLVDGGGNDRYRGGMLVQGTATANGIGMLLDRHGANRFEVGLAARPHARAWGHAEWFAGLPSIGLFLRQDAPTYLRNQQTIERPWLPGRVDAQSNETSSKTCEELTTKQLRQSLASLKREFFDAVHALGEKLACTTLTDEHWGILEQELVTHPASPLAPWLARKAAPHRDALLHALELHPSCGVRAAALRVRSSVPAALSALRSTCWRLQAAARAELTRLGAWPSTGR